MIALQILPRLPNGRDGVADYAYTLAQRLSSAHHIDTVFAPAEQTNLAVTGFDVVPLLSVATAEREFDHVILHFVNYGYEKHGVPAALLSILRDVRRRCRGTFVTIFHELYASAPPWKSAFWLRPFQMRIARSIAQLSDACLVSNETALEQLRRLCPAVRASVHPVGSNFGEPDLSTAQIAGRDPHRWAICGGTELVERSLRSFRAIPHRIPESIFPRELCVIGGNDNPVTRALIVDLANVRAEYHPDVAAGTASQLLSSCSFGWIDYFHRAPAPASAISKSSVFAALCAHAVIPIFPHHLTGATQSNPARYFVDEHQRDLPANDERASAAERAYVWYQQNASSAHLAEQIAAMLKQGFTNAR